MGHSIQALVIGEPRAAAASVELPHTRPVTVGCGLRIVPITDATFDSLRERSPELDDPPISEFWRMSGPLLFAIKRLSELGPVAYVETDYFGGTGEQAAAVWERGELRMRPSKAERGPINAALRLLGVRARAPQDEFDAVGLGARRNNDDWLDADGA